VSLPSGFHLACTFRRKNVESLALSFRTHRSPGIDPFKLASLNPESSNQFFETLEEWNDYVERQCAAYARNGPPQYLDEAALLIKIVVD
jgi:hypothetical protein